MPELPEVETIVRKLNQVLPGKVVASLQVLHAKAMPESQPDALVGWQIVAVSRRAKLIQILTQHPQQTNQQKYAVIHLKMTGQLIYQDQGQRIGGGHPTADWTNDLPSSHTRLWLGFTDHSKLFFNDQRLFGWWKIIEASDLPKLHQGLGPDVVDPAFTADYFAAACSRRSVPIKQVLMDNQVVCGVGNIYACDALNLSQLSPFRPAKSLTTAEIEKLVAAAKEVIALGVELGGTTFDGKYVDIDGMAGRYQGVVRVYGREGQPCPHCQTPVAKKQLAGRGTYYCPSCQR